MTSYEVRIRFSDGSVGERHFAAMTVEPGSMLAPLRESAYFARVHLDFGALTWPNGFDVAPNSFAASWRQPAGSAGTRPELDHISGTS
jgi:hypothetical protein